MDLIKSFTRKQWDFRKRKSDNHKNITILETKYSLYKNSLLKLSRL